jgi:hypothetical protein
VLDKSARPRPLSATHPGPKPGDFPLASVESRAAARVRVQRLAEADRPQKGDVLIQLTAMGWPDRHRKILQILHGHGRLERKPERIPGLPLIWLALPEGFHPESLLEGAPTVIGDVTGEAPAERDGSVRALRILARDLPFFVDFMTTQEQVTLMGQASGKSWESKRTSGRCEGTDD